MRKMHSMQNLDPFLCLFYFILFIFLWRPSIPPSICNIQDEPTTIIFFVSSYEEWVDRFGRENQATLFFIHCFLFFCLFFRVRIDYATRRLRSLFLRSLERIKM